MGRPNKQVYEYDFDGNFIRKYNSISDFRKKHYPLDNGKRPIFVKKNNGYDFHVTLQETIVVTERIYRDNIVFLLKIYNSKLCKVNSSKPIQMLNLKNEVIAEFSSLPMAMMLLKDDFKLDTIYRQLNLRIHSGTKRLVKDYYFKYKN